MVWESHVKSRKRIIIGEWINYCSIRRLSLKVASVLTREVIGLGIEAWYLTRDSMQPP
jgi:hypothetical protein